MQSDTLAALHATKARAVWQRGFLPVQSKLPSVAPCGVCGLL